MTEYLTFLGQYTETMDKFDALENSDLNDAELNYYLQALLRIEQKMLGVLQ